VTTLTELADVSLDVVARHQQPSGAYPASPDFSAYRGYCWFRDGSFIADGMSAADAAGSADRFHDWCARTVLGQAERIGAAVAGARRGEPVPGSAMLPARFAFDGQLGTDPWWDFQLDGYGTWLWAVVEHARRHGRDLERWRPAVALVVDYLAVSWQRPCFDWWEEHDEHVHVPTLGCVGGGLEAVLGAGLLEPAAADEAREAAVGIRALVDREGTVEGRLTKWIGRSDPDASLSALVAPLGWIGADDPRAAATVEAVTRVLAVDGGVHRFADDVFYGGGQWPLLTCLLGQARLALGDRDGALAALEWAASTATPEGLLPEQVDRHLIAPEHRAEWLERWGTVATPLLWSHGQYLRLWHDLGRP
jgi:GH15 family glucan-1,4-alpha-glucosidase